MPSTLSNFQLSAVAAPDDFIVGYDEAVLNGERRWTVSTLANAVSGITKNALSDNMYSGGSLGFRNKIINGDAKISQRYGNTVKVASSVDGFGVPVDRFSFTDSIGSNWPTNGIITYKRNDIRDLPSFTNSVLLSTSTVGTIGVNAACGIKQSLEGINISDLAWGTSSAQPITVSFWVKSSLTGTHSLVVNGLIDDRTTTRRYASTYNISSTSWEYKSITIPGDTTASTTWFTGTSAAGLNLIWGLGTGTNFQVTPGSWGSGNGIQSSGTVNIIANAGATFQFTGVQLEKGSTATPFEHRPIGTELALCQRYYEKSYDLNVAVGTASTPGLIEKRSTHNSIQGDLQNVYFKQSKRNNPAITLYNPAVNNQIGVWYDFTLGDGTTRTVQSLAVGHSAFMVVGVSVPLEYGYGGHYTADADL